MDDVRSVIPLFAAWDRVRPPYSFASCQAGFYRKIQHTRGYLYNFDPMKRVALNTLMVMVMLSSLLGQAFAMSFNPALIAHALEHDAASPTTGLSPTLAAESNDADDHDHHHDHDGKFDDAAHQLLHAVPHLQLFAVTDFPVLQWAAEKELRYAFSISHFLETSPEPLFRPPRPPFAS